MTKTKKLITGAMLVAIATILSLISVFQLPFGGSVTAASMLPIVIAAYILGTKYGFICAFAFSIIQLIMGGKTVSALFLPGDEQVPVITGILICLLDYIAAYTVIGIAGVFKGKFKNDYAGITVGAIVALALRYVVHIISGALFYGAWAEWFFSQDGFYSIGSKILASFSGTALSVVYSVFYNGLYMIPEIIITAVLAPIVLKLIYKSSLVNK